MVLNLADLLIAAVLVGVACVVTYITLQSAFRHAISDLRLSTDRQLNDLAGAIQELETRVAKLSSEISGSRTMTAASAQLSAPVMKSPTSNVAAKTVAPRKQKEEVTPEMLVVMAAAVTAFLGKKVRIRSAKMLQSPYEIVNPWSQQGRVFVQASHNLRSRG